MHISFKRLTLAVASVGLLTIYGCGGGGGGDTSDVDVTVVDGAIQNATVCLDKNGNGACDADEPSGTTDASGKVKLKVSSADVGKFPVVAVVPVGAIDADTGPVRTGFTMKAPADNTAIVSPLTTLVQTLVEDSGLTSAVAEVEVRAQAGLTLSLFADFTKGTSAEDQKAGVLARLIVVTTQQHVTALVSTIGASSLDGAVITQEKLNQAIRKRILERLPVMAAVVPAVVAMAPAAREAEIASQAGQLVVGNELTTSTIGTIVAINNQAPASSTATAIQQVQTFVSLLDAAFASNALDLAAIDDAFVDKCSINSGYTLKTSKAYREANPMLSALYNRYRVGSMRTNVEVVAERTSTNTDGSSRREIDVKYKVTYTDGTSTDPSMEGVTTLISGSSQGSVFGPGRACSVPQVGSNLRFFGNRRIVDTNLRPWNIRNERYNIASGAPLASAVDYSRYVQIRMIDPSGFSTYMVVTGPGLPQTAGLKLLSPRIQRDAALFAGKRGNYVDWRDDDSFRFCRNSDGGVSNASTVDCNANGAQGNSFGAFNNSPSQIDSSFNNIGFVAGGEYTVKVYNDDGWIGVNGHASKTPIATYTTRLRALPYSAVALAGTGTDNDLYPRMSTSLSKAEIATAFNTKAAFSTNVNFTALGTLPDATKFGFGEISAYTEGDAAGVASTPFGGWPRSRQPELGVAVPALGASSVTGFSVSAATSVLVTPRYAEIFLSQNNRRNGRIGSAITFETVVP